MTWLLVFSLCLFNSHVNINGQQLCGSNYSHSNKRMNWWPASSLKIFPALAAWELLNKKRIKKHVFKTLVYSSNSSYDYLVDKLGRDRLSIWLKKKGFKDTWISRPYARRGRFKGSIKHRSCRSNCTSMKDLQRCLNYALKYKTLRIALRRPTAGSLVFGKFGFVYRHHFILNMRIKESNLTIAIPAKSKYAIIKKKLINYIRKIK